jgi:hypothetical protein
LFPLVHPLQNQLFDVDQSYGGGDVLFFETSSGSLK